MWLKGVQLYGHKHSFLLHGSMPWFRRGDATYPKGGPSFTSFLWPTCEQVPPSLTDCAEDLVGNVYLCLCVSFVTVFGLKPEQYILN